MSAWRDRTRTNINECSEKVWKEWSHQATELQTLRDDVENRKKEGDKFYKMDEESIVTIREELSEDFFSLAESHLREVRGLVEMLDDGLLDAQLQLEKYERERQQQEDEGRTTSITISDEEQPARERQTIVDDEPLVTTNAETTAFSEEQPPREVGATTTTDVATGHPIGTANIDIGDIDTSDKKRS